MTAGSPLMKSVLTTLAKSFLISLGLSSGMSAADVAIQKNIDGSGTTALIMSNEEMEDIMKIVKSLEESGLLIKEISEAIKNEAKEQKGGFLSMLLGTLAASILGNTLAGKEVIRAGERVMPPRPLTSFEIKKYYQNEPKFDCVYSKNNLSITKDGAYIINLDKYESIGTRWIVLYVNTDNVT